MQAVQSIIGNNSSSAVQFHTSAAAAGQSARWLTRLLGCWHMEMGLPLTQGAETYRACTACGARRRFDPSNWRMTGSYYYPAVKG